MSQTITDFLEARIAEDERRANYYGPLALGNARVLAECAAKRAIIETFPVKNGEHGPLGSRVLETLAAVHKNHPDYREDWA